MNKLIEEKRYDDAVKIFECGSQRGFTTTSGRVFPSDVVMLAIEALYQLVKILFRRSRNYFIWNFFFNRIQRNH